MLPKDGPKVGVNILHFPSFSLYGAKLRGYALSGNFRNFGSLMGPAGFLFLSFFAHFSSFPMQFVCSIS